MSVSPLPHTPALRPRPTTFRLGRYQVVDEIGVGGMARVHLARADGPGGFQKWVALKRIYGHLSEDRAFVDMFLDEARVAARISHPNVAQVFELGRSGTAYWIAMEYLHGEPLREVVRARSEQGRPAMRPALAAKVVADAAEGLHAAHELRGNDGELLYLVHRDVSPHNIFVTFDGAVKLVDFGIAAGAGRLACTRVGTLKGKLAYMSPEQARGLRVDRRTDVFALGVVLWEATVLRRLFKRESTAMTVAAVLRDPIPSPTRIRPGFPQNLEAVVMKALRRDPTKRYQTMAELADALDEFILSTHKAAGQAQVATWMRSAFADRINTRERLMHGDAVDEETIVDVDLSTNSSVVAETPPSVSSFANERRPRRPLLIPLIIAIVVGVAGVTGFGGWYLGTRVRADQDGARTTTAQLGAPAVPAPEAGAPSGTASGSPVEAQEPAPTVVDAAPDEPDQPQPAAGDADTNPPHEEAQPPAHAPETRRPRRSTTATQAGNGFLNVISVPVAKVWLDRRVLGTTPLSKVRVPSGNHVLKLQAVRGAGSSQRRVSIRPDKVTYVSVRLEP